jgi:hypothetical protein
MYKLIKCWIFTAIVCLFFVGSLCFAQGPNFRPSGWDNGEKNGWNTDTPPGNHSSNSQQQSVPVPEPTTVALLGIGLAGLAGVAAIRRHKKKAVDKS